MFGSTVLDVTIGMIFVFLLVSILCSSIREGIESWLKTRAAYLELGIRELLHDPHANGIARAFYQHPLISSLFARDYEVRKRPTRPTLFARGRNLPSYIPAQNFALALMDIAARGPHTNLANSDPAAPPMSFESIRQNLLYIQNTKVQRVLLNALDTAQGDLDNVQRFLESWYNASMDRISGWYKRSTQWILFIIGVCLAVVMNINALSLINYLSHNEPARSALVARAQKATGDTAYLNRSYQQTKQDLDSLALPVGWDPQWRPFQSHGKAGMLWIWLQPILGWLIIALAATMGAPFWFDLLNKVTVVRSTVKPHEKSPEEASEDRQTQQGSAVIVQEKAPAPAQQLQQMPPPAAKMPAILDADSDKDGEAVIVEHPTIDENLPIAQGGVA